MFVVAALQIRFYNQDNYYCYEADGQENWYGNFLWLPINYGAPAEVIHAGLYSIVSAFSLKVFII